ncbi:MAG: class I SAM-dependent methyltransferase [Christensenellales bacterium]
MDDYIRGNKAAWEEAFEHRDPAWGMDITRRIRQEAYPFFNRDMVRTLQQYDLSGKVISQFCCNNGRELLSLVKASNALQGYGFDIAENQVAFARGKAEELGLPCRFIAGNILDIGADYDGAFDFLFITIGALCWFKDLKAFFQVVSRCMKPGAGLVINESHPFTSMLAAPGEADYDEDHPASCRYSYFEREWVGMEGMHYIAGKAYPSKPFTDYSHPLSDIVGAMHDNGLMITGLQEFDYDISDSFSHLAHQGLPLSLILEGRRVPGR